MARKVVKINAHCSCKKRRALLRREPPEANVGRRYDRVGRALKVDDVLTSVGKHFAREAAKEALNKRQRALLFVDGEELEREEARVDARKLMPPARRWLVSTTKVTKSDAYWVKRL